jgi:hypothetical protein
MALGEPCAGKPLARFDEGAIGPIPVALLYSMLATNYQRGLIPRKIVLVLRLDSGARVRKHRQVWTTQSSSSGRLN